MQTYLPDSAGRRSCCGSPITRGTLEKTYGIRIKDAMITDIPGYTWATVPALVQGGIKYFSSGPNYVPTLPDEGDRVGRFNRAWGDKPFYWVSPSGQEKLLFWVAAKGYSWFHAWIAGQAGQNTAGHLFEYLRELDQKKNPYDMVQLRYTIIADNGPTDPNLPDFVKSWNARYDSPKIVIATAGADVRGVRAAVGRQDSHHMPETLLRTGKMGHSPLCASWVLSAGLPKSWFKRRYYSV